jgi:carboxylesterase type B
MAAPNVTIATGALAGEQADGVASYKGIPYAASPALDARWKPPAPAKGWTGTRDATAFGPDPVQIPVVRKKSRAPGVGEDCLSLNVWAPADRAGGPYPVMVWFEGGSFINASGASARVDGANFARRGVILITTNYRVGVFGYLAHPLLSAESGHAASGNYGFMDQLAALKWVRENIAAFGGDPKRVTIFGVSAGSASIALMLTSPMARSLFDQVVLESPGSLRPLAPLAESEAAGKIVGDDLAAMRRLPADELLKKNGLIGPKVRGLTTPRILRPIHDGYAIPRDEADAYVDGDFAHVPMMVGSTANEGGWAVGDMPINTLAEYRAYMQQNFNDMTEEALRVYPANTDAEVKPSLAEVFGDTQFSYGARGVGRASARYQPQTFRFVFAHGTAGHSDDTSYIFGTEDSGEFGSSGKDGATTTSGKMISDAMIGYWSQFARTGDPNGGGLPVWPAYDPLRDNYLKFGENDITVGTNWRTDKLDFIERYFASRGVATVGAVSGAAAKAGR